MSIILRSTQSSSPWRESSFLALFFPPCYQYCSGYCPALMRSLAQRNLSTRQLLVLVPTCALILFAGSQLELHSSTNSFQPSTETFTVTTIVSSSVTDTSCPSPDAPRRPQLEHTSSCRPLSSSDPAFAIELCEDYGQCNSFSLRVRRTSAESCASAESTANELIGGEPSLRSWMKAERGPDAFWLRTDGAERYSDGWSFYEGDCSYRFDVSLHNPGETIIQLWHMHENYQSFSEANTSWAYLHRTPLLPRDTTLQPCPSTCEPIPRRLLHSPDPMLDFLPACTGPEPIQGAYVPNHIADILEPPYPIVQPLNLPVAGRYQFVPNGCRWKHAGLRFGELTPCTRKEQRVLFIGDSHTRVASDAVVWRLRGNRNLMLESEKQGHKSAMIDNTEIAFSWDPTGESVLSMTCDDLANVTSVVFGVTHHFITSQTSLVDGRRRAVDRISTLASLVRSCSTDSMDPSTDPESESSSSSSTIPLVFLLGTAQPPRLDHWPREFNDRRTNVRLQYWRDMLLARARAEGYAIVDMFSLSLPHAMEALGLDSAHFSGTDAIDPIVDEILGKAGVCPPMENSSVYV